MQSTVLHPRPSHLVFHSADQVRLIAPYLSISDLITASALCRSSHALFDTDVAWHDRLKAAERIQHVADENVLPAHCELSAAQLAAQPLPPLSVAAALCLQAWKEVAKQHRHYEPVPSHPLVSPLSSTYRSLTTTMAE